MNYWANQNDPTPKMIKDYAKESKNCVVISKEKEGHMGWDMRSGLEISQGNVIIVIDGDLQFNSNLVFKVYDELKYKNLDLCKTYRVMREDGIYRSVISKIFNFIFDLLFPSPNKNKDFSDINSKPKAFTRHVYETMNLKSNDWFIDCEIMIFAREHNLKIGTMPIRFYKSDRESFVKPVAIFEFLKNLINYKIRSIKDS